MVNLILGLLLIASSIAAKENPSGQNKQDQIPVLTSGKSDYGSIPTKKVSPEYSEDPEEEEQVSSYTRLKNCANLLGATAGIISFSALLGVITYYVFISEKINL